MSILKSFEISHVYGCSNRFGIVRIYLDDANKMDIRISGDVGIESLEALLMCHPELEEIRDRAGRLHRRGSWYPVMLDDNGEVLPPDHQGAPVGEDISWAIHYLKAEGWETTNPILTIGDNGLVIEDATEVWVRDVYDIFWHWAQKLGSKPEELFKELWIKDTTTRSQIELEIAHLAYTPNTGFRDDVDYVDIDVLYK